MKDIKLTGDRITSHGLVNIYKCNGASFDNISISGHLYGSYASGLAVYSSENVTITNSNFSGNYRGISLGDSSYSSNNAIISNTILSDNNNYGLYVRYSDNVSVIDNEFYGNSYAGAYISYSDSGFYSENQFLDNGRGVYLYSGADNNEFYNNTIDGSIYYGIEFASIAAMSQYFSGNNISNEPYYHCYNNNSFSLSDIELNADKVTNRGLINVYNCPNADFDNVSLSGHLYGSYASGLAVYSSDNVTITNSNFSGNYNGVSLGDLSLIHI